MNTTTNSPKLDRATRAVTALESKIYRSYSPEKSQKFTVFEGDLWNARDKVVRKRYAWHFREIDSTAKFLACIRGGQFAWPGGYEIFFYTSDGGTLCFESACENVRLICGAIRDNDNSGWRVVGCECAANVDGPIVCDDTGKTIVEGGEEETSEV